MTAGENLSESSQYSVIGETYSNRHFRDLSKQGQEEGVSTDVGLLDPVDIFAGLISGGGYLSLKVGLGTGLKFGASLDISETYTITESFIGKMESFMKEMNVLDKDDPSIARDKVRIRENQSDEKLPSRPYLYSPYHGEPVAKSATKN